MADGYAGADPAALDRTGQAASDASTESGFVADNVRAAMELAALDGDLPATLDRFGEALSVFGRLLHLRAEALRLADSGMELLAASMFSSATSELESSLLVYVGDRVAETGRSSFDELDGHDRSWLGEMTAFLAGDVGNIWNGGGDGVPIGQLVAGCLRVGRSTSWLLTSMPANSFPLFDTGAIGSRLPWFRTPDRFWDGFDRANPTRTGNYGAHVSHAVDGFRSGSRVPTASFALRTLGIAGGLYGTADGMVTLVDHGNPIRAYHEHGAGYVADVAGTAFSASSTAFLLAPNPVTGGIMVVSGAVWIGAELWDHREEVLSMAGAAWDTVGDVGEWYLDVNVAVAETVADGAGWAIDVGSEALESVGGAVVDGGRAIVSGGRTVLDTGGAVLDGLADGASSLPLVGGWFD